nr:transport and Golgi organization protein 1 homolog isoform X1 [Ciona intestinalis]|eukprot:XP_026689640.1 transport and Golgi organization protein 1 homolog isoform X1 [Ciona intestinalis]
MNKDKLYFGNAEVTSTHYRNNIDGNPELGSESKENKMILRSLELKLQSKMKDDGVLVDEAYGNAVDLRARLRDLVLQIKHKELEENISILATDEAKELKQRLFELEQYLEVWKKKEALFLTSVASEAEIVNRIQKLEHNLVQRKSEDRDLSQARQEAEDLKWRLGKLEDVLENKSILPSSHFNRLKDSLESEIEERKKMDRRALLATEREMLLMKTKLTALEQQLHGHGEGNKEFIDMIKSDADILKKRLGQLESNVVTRKSNKELLQISENKQEALLGRISLLEVELERRKKDEVALQSAQQEAAELKEKFGHLDVRMKEIMEKQNPLLQEKILHLENEVKTRKETESASIFKVQEEAANVMNKILDLEKLLHENKQENNSKQHMNEVSVLKNQIKRLEEELNKRTRLDTNRNERSTKREEELQMRVNSLKNELQAMVKHEETAEKHFKQSQEIINRVIALEKQVNVKLNADSKLNNIEAKQEKNALRKISDGISLNDFWDLIPTKQKCDAVLKDSGTVNLKEELIKQKDDAFVNETIAETNTVEKCTFEIEERIRCDIARSSLHCKALKCCWDPHPNPEIPDCFFSRVQLSRKSQQMKKLEDSYEKLHEGKEVDWDESVKEKEADKTKKSTWDETLGVADIKTEIILKSKTEAIENANGETNGTMLGDKDGKQETNVIEDKKTENDKSDTTVDDVKDEFQWQSAQASIKFVQRETVVQQEGETETNDPLIDNGNRKKESLKQTNEIVPKKEPHQENFKSSQDEQTNNDSTGKDGMSDYSEILKTEKVNRDGEPYVESVAVKIMLLVFELPFDVVYVLTPLALWWLSLLPPEYQDDVFGISWPTILLTTAVGFLFLWIMLWRTRVSRRNRKQQQLNSALVELKAQLETMASENLEKEKEFKETQTELEKNRITLKEALEEKSKDKDLLTNLKQTVKKMQQEINSKVSEISEFNSNLVASQKEKNQLEKVVTQNQKSLEQKQKETQDAEKKAAQLKSEMKDLVKQRKMVEENLKDSQDRLKREEKKKQELEQNLQTSMDSEQNLSEQLKLLESKVKSTMEEKQTMEQEVDVLKDCLLQFKGVQEGLTEDGDDELDEDNLTDKQKEKLKDLIDVSRIQRRLKQAEMEKGRLTFDLEAEKKAREKKEEMVSEWEAKCENERLIKSKTERELQMLQAKLNVMQDFYAKREVEMQGKLGKEQSNRESSESKLAEKDERTLLLEQKLDDYKQMIEDSRKEYEEEKKQRKSEINQYEKKAHANWLASREAERKLDEATREISQLRMELSENQQCLRDLEEREPPFLFRPRPLPPPSGRPAALLRNGPNQSYDRSSPQPVRGMRRDTSPTGSLQEEFRPHRPPSNHSMQDRRPPSRGSMHDLHRPPSMFDGRMPPPHLHEQFGPPPMRDGPPPMRDGPPPMRDGPPPMRDGPPPMRDGPPPMRNGPPPMRDGPPPMRDGPPPMRDGPPPMRDGPPLMRDGPPPMRDGPPPMRDGPPPMRDGPPPIRDGPPPMRDGPPPMRDGPPPMRDGPPPMRDGPPPMRDGPPPMRDGPPPMRDGPPPMRDGPPPMRDGPPPMRDGPPKGMGSQLPLQRRAGSRNEGPIMTSSPYADHHMVPARGPPSATFLHANVPPSNSAPSLPPPSDSIATNANPYRR